MSVSASVNGHATGDDLLLRVEDLVVDYPTDAGTVKAVSGISFDIARGETLGLVGESGCGKSTTGRAIMMLPAPTSGSVYFDGVELQRLSGRQLRRKRTDMLMIFQDPISSLNPRRLVKEIVAEGLVIWGRSVTDAAIDDVLAAVGLDPAAVRDRRPDELSGGQCQRIAIARALMLDPSLVVCDEPVSALDVSVQAQILNLLRDLRHRFDLTLLFIAHDLAVVKNISDRIAVMYLGKLCEIAPADRLYEEPLHPYTVALLEAIPVPDPTVPIEPMEISGDPASPLNPPSGCRFRTRCPRAEERCAVEEPQMREMAPGHSVACHFPGSSLTRVGISTTSAAHASGSALTPSDTDPPTKN